MRANLREFIRRFIVGYIETNMYLVYQNRKGIIIDPGFIEAEAQAILNKLRNLVDEIPAIFLTHSHFDHISGCSILKKEFHSEIFCQPLDAQILSDPQKTGAFFLGVSKYNISADKFFADGQEIKLIDLNFKILHTPGHTKGSVSILLEDDYLFSGDTIFKDGIGRTDLYGGDYEAEINSIETKILTLAPDTIIYPGHGPETTVKSELRNFT